MKGLRHTGITVKNLKRQLHFYRGLLGLKTVRQMRESGKFISTISGLKEVEVTTVKLAAEDNSLVELLCYHTHPAKKLSKKEIFHTGFSHAAFTVKDVEAVYKRLKKSGIKFNSLPQVSSDGYAKVVFCRDPEGNLIEFVEVIGDK